MTPGTDGGAPIAISLKGVDKFYGRHQALRGIDLTVARGEAIAICGPSGSGKSTLVRCLAHLETHEAGAIVVNGIALSGANRHSIRDVRRECGMVFQHFNLFPHMTILENCTFAPRVSLGLSVAVAETLARRELARVRLDDQASKYPEELSGGQQQRAAIARALCMSPRIMLFDEPTSALDPEMVGEVLAVMSDLARDGMTMLCVTHELGFARRFADRCVFMADGEIVEVADAPTFFATPRSPRLAAFLASRLAPR